MRNHEANSHVRACVEDGHVMVSVTTVSFDMSLKETAVALCNGLTLVLADEEQANHPVRLTELIEETGGDIFNATPSRMLQYMESGTFCRALSGCRVVMSGGEAYSMQLLEKLRQVTCARIFNTYGPTEITVSCNACELTDRDRITVGRPLLNYVEYIADSDGNLLPPGVTGELYVGGPGVAAGYHGLPEMTAERFVQFQGMRVYKTGDYAKWTRSGEVVILGRTDNQVKLRGLRIELEEVEQAILRCPGIRQTVVLIRGIEGTEHLCAYYTAEEAVLPETLREQLKNSLTRYMIPDAYRQMERFPMTPNGKIDQKALPEAQLAGAGEYVEPQTETERTFCRIFAEVLHAMKEYGMDIELSEDEDYERALEETRQDPEKAKVLSSMIAYQNMGHGKKTVGIAKENAYTMKVLYRLGYHWPTTSRAYVGKLVAALDGLGFFKEQERDK